VGRIIVDEEQSRFAHGLNVTARKAGDRTSLEGFRPLRPMSLIPADCAS
jgi:hypothetical protein